MQRFEGQLLPEIGSPFFALRRPFGHLHFAKCFESWGRDCDFEFRLCRHVRGIFASWHNVKLFAIPSLHWASNYAETPGLWREMYGSRLLCVLTPPVLAYYSGYILKYHLCQDLAWLTTTS